MKRIYNAPNLEAKEYAQLENVFAYCDRQPNHTPECYDQTGSGNAGDKPKDNPSGSTSHSDLGMATKGTDDCGGGFVGSGGDI